MGKFVTYTICWHLFFAFFKYYQKKNGTKEGSAIFYVGYFDATSEDHRSNCLMRVELVHGYGLRISYNISLVHFGTWVLLCRTFPSRTYKGNQKRKFSKQPL